MNSMIVPMPVDYFEQHSRFHRVAVSFFPIEENPYSHVRLPQEGERYVREIYVVGSWPKSEDVYLVALWVEYRSEDIYIEIRQVGSEIIENLPRHKKLPYYAMEAYYETLSEEFVGTVIEGNEFNVR